MKKLLGLVFFITATGLFAQEVLVSKTSQVHFFSKTPLEDIEAASTQSTCVLNKKTGQIVVSIPIKSFKFDKNLMQEHFNENYMESDTYPEATFKGTIEAIATVNFAQDGDYKVQLKGVFTIHGVAKDRTIEAVISIKKGVVTGSAKFKVPLDDHKIKKPEIVFAKIADTIEVDVAYEFGAYVKK